MSFQQIIHSCRAAADESIAMFVGCLHDLPGTMNMGAPMVAPSPGDSQLKNAVKAALIEVLEERSDLLRDVLAEVMEDVALVRAIQEGEASEAISRDEIFRALEGRA